MLVVIKDEVQAEDELGGEKILPNLLTVSSFIYCGTKKNNASIFLQMHPSAPLLSTSFNCYLVQVFVILPKKLGIENKGEKTAL